MGPYYLLNTWCNVSGNSFIGKCEECGLKF